MTTPQEFLTQFATDILDNPDNRQILIAGWTKHLEAREEAIRREAVAGKGYIKPGEYYSEAHGPIKINGPIKPVTPGEFTADV